MSPCSTRTWISASSYNFDQQLTSSKDTGYYDFDSIMHYPATGFTRNGLDSMETVPVGIPIGQRNGLSAGDIDGISRAYGFTPTATTITTVPSGLPITVDGVAAVSPTSFDWAPGSTHTIAVNTQAGSADPRYVFVRWSDGGDPSHTITASAGQTVFCAVFQTQHKFSYDVGSGSGTVDATPVSADGYYPGAAARAHHRHSRRGQPVRPLGRHRHHQPSAAGYSVVRHRCHRRSAAPQRPVSRNLQHASPDHHRFRAARPHHCDRWHSAT